VSGAVSARIVLLDNQIVDRNRLPIGRVDDLEIEVGGGKPRVTAMLVGSEALGERVGGLLGQVMAAVSARLRPRGGAAGPPRIGVDSIRVLEPLIELDLSKDEMQEVAGLEHWLATHFVGRLPGSGDASQ
jgi:hypothetical protein